ncbi:MAG: hypothetical protein JW993_06305 [Sedimentisphaerales bacterium]|nr:hypothetical protein [Sedimentisphaerales bacterium]
MELDSATGERIRVLKAIDFDFAFLALLTHRGLKPMSRWGKPLAGAGLEALRQLGLQTRKIRRTVRMDKSFNETVFACAPGYLDIYAAHFDHRPVDSSAETVRIEGFLFGYPPCCVAQYVKHHYAPDEFPIHKEQPLFHWVCQGCQITSLLVPAYKEIYRLVDRC